MAAVSEAAEGAARRVRRPRAAGALYGGGARARPRRGDQSPERRRAVGDARAGGWAGPRERAREGRARGPRRPRHPPPDAGRQGTPARDPGAHADAVPQTGRPRPTRALRRARERRQAVDSRRPSRPRARQRGPAPARRPGPDAIGRRGPLPAALRRARPADPARQSPPERHPHRLPLAAGEAGRRGRRVGVPQGATVVRGGPPARAHPQAAGCTVTRASAVQVEHHPELVVAAVRAMLERTRPGRRRTGRRAPASVTA